MLCFIRTVGSWILHALRYGDNGVLDSPCSALLGPWCPAFSSSAFWGQWGPVFSMLCFIRTVVSCILHALRSGDSGVQDSPCSALWGQWGPGFSMLCFMGTVGSWILHALLYGDIGVLDSPCYALREVVCYTHAIAAASGATGSDSPYSIVTTR